MASVAAWYWVVAGWLMELIRNEPELEVRRYGEMVARWWRDGGGKEKRPKVPRNRFLLIETPSIALVAWLMH